MQYHCLVHNSCLGTNGFSSSIKQCNGPSVTAGGSATALLFSAGSTPSELTFRHHILLEEDMIDRSPTPHTTNNWRLPRDTVLCYRLSGPNVPATVALSYIVVVHDLLCLS
ncbi:hypothetical protein T07_5896 [Trichinella nelsoni]|uniref:Uncharacterized protein n=1 Tax=Trichinella nelsoni TaxID=6336 RepID=A0A0V0SFR1_9BILA|nr:hypothetical protein T07_5896 [Trichinella nelsoni]